MKLSTSRRNNNIGNADQKMEQYTVFVVEDSADDRRQAVQELRKSPLINAIHCFESGDKLIDYFISEGYYSGNLMRYVPSLILLDIHVPGSSGIETLKNLKEHPLTDDIPVIIMTSDESEKNPATVYKLKANGFINKPVDIDQVNKVIRTGWGWPANHVPY